MTTKNKVEAAKSEVEDLAAQMKANRERAQQLRAQSRDDRGRIDLLKDLIALEIAEGRDASKLSRDARDLRCAYEDAENAIVLLDRQHGEIEQRHDEAIKVVARIAQQAAACDYGRALDELQTCLANFYQSDVSPLMAELDSHAARVREVENTLRDCGALISMPCIEYAHRYAPQSGGRALPLARALEANASGHEYSASWKPVRTGPAR